MPPFFSSRLMLDWFSSWKFNFLFPSVSSLGIVSIDKFWLSIVSVSSKGCLSKIQSSLPDALFLTRDTYEVFPEIYNVCKLFSIIKMFYSTCAAASAGCRFGDCGSFSACTAMFISF